MKSNSVDSFNQLRETNIIPFPLYKGEGMFMDEVPDMNLVVNAKLLKDIIYTKDDISVMVPVGTQVLVDIDASIALVDSDHVDIFEDEYEVMYPN